MNQAIKEAAQEDYKALEPMFEKPNGGTIEEDCILENIGSHNLEEKFRGVKFFTLGFLIKLIEDSELAEKVELKNGMDKDWMKFHAERDTFSYSAKSIDDIKEMDPEFLEIIRTKYFLFLDEFVAKEGGGYWAVLVRNLARCLEMGVVVANTNSDISNLIGKVHAGGSRSGRSNVWSFVVVKLDKTDWELLNCCYDLEKDNNNFMNKIKVIIQNSSDFKPGGKFSIEKLLENVNISNSEESKFVRFFQEIINNLIPKSRPGIAFVVFDFIMNFEGDSPYNLAQFINNLVKHVSDWLIDRKKNIEVKTQGKMGTLALYLSNAYDKTRIKPEIEHRKSYLNDHLYYLNNPVDDGEWMFTTFPFEGRVKNLEVYDKSSNRKKEWNVETTHFDEDEVITLLSCLFIKSSQSVAFDLEQGHDESTKIGFDTLTTSNSEALKLDGNKLEVLAAVSIIDASHRKNGSLTASLSGQNGLDFIENILGNIIRSRNYLRSTEILLEFPVISKKSSFPLDTFLENCKIPFLYPANLEVPKLLENLTKDGIVKVGYCERTKDKTKIDFKFAFDFLDFPIPSLPKKSKSEKLSESEKRRKIEKFYVVAECKNWASTIQSKDLISILEKSYTQEQSFLSLLFCNNLQTNLDQEFHKFCSEHDINVYKIVLRSKENQFTFSIEPVYVCDISDLPQLICIIFETKVINDIIIEESREF